MFDDVDTNALMKRWALMIIVVVSYSVFLADKLVEMYPGSEFLFYLVVPVIIALAWPSPKTKSSNESG